ncbi:MAG: PQQ-binding-like beta-propeller repeat protein [Chthonomonadales bacterium]
MRNLLTILLCLVPSVAFGQKETTFRFVHVTDTHLTASANIEPLKQLAGELNAMSPMPAFVVDSGDVTEAARPEEFARFQEAAGLLKMPFCCAPGNHDTRWSANGKQAFKDVFKQLYQSFDYGGCHFVVLDSTMLLEHQGHFDTYELKWLATDLKKMKKETPVFFFFHHPVGRRGLDVDNEDTFLRLIAPYNVIALFVGHGHADIQWKINGINCFMAKGLYQGSYNMIDADATGFKIRRVTTKNRGGEPDMLATIPRVSPPYSHAEFLWGDPNVLLLERRRPLVQLEVGKLGAHDDRVVATYRIDNGPTKPMARDVRDHDSASYLTEFFTKELSPGTHLLTMELTDLEKQVYRRLEPFVVERLSGSPKRAWDDPFKATESIQGSPIVVGDLVIYGALDGTVTAIETKNGRKRWSTPTKGAITGTPVATEDSILIGSVDHFLYALEIGSGRVKWKHDCASPILSTPAIGGGIICVGCDRKIVGLDPQTGAEKWSVPTGGFFQSRALFADGRFFLGGWDNTLYAVNPDGTVAWKQVIGKSKAGQGATSFYFSPAIASPAGANGHVFICTNDGRLHAFRSSNGEEIWTAHAPADGDGMGYSSPLAADGMVYVGGLGKLGSVYAFDASTGELKWHAKTGSENYDSSAGLQGDNLTIGSTAGLITWIDRKTGAIKYTYSLDPGWMFSTPTSVGKVTYATSMNGMAYAIKIPD